MYKPTFDFLPSDNQSTPTPKSKFVIYSPSRSLNDRNCSKSHCGCQSCLLNGDKNVTGYYFKNLSQHQIFF